MIVVGGSYHESVLIPDSEQFAGSGLRAAAAMPAGRCELVTAVDEAHTTDADSAYATLGVSARNVGRDQRVGFRYTTPMSSPVIDGPSAVLDTPLMADDGTVLMFGMVETGSRSIRADRLVFDPQQPRGLEAAALAGVEADRLVVVGNAREIRALAEGEHDLQVAAARVAAETDAVGVIVKDSARGCLVVDRASDRIVRVGAYPTRSVWPIGSGDVFAAGFTHAWEGGATLAEAAAVGSASAAWWCATRVFAVPPEILGGTDPSTIHPAIASELPAADGQFDVYLASPFFSLAERWLVETCRNALSGMGITVFSPFHDVGPGGDEVAGPDLDGLRDSNAVLAVVDGWDPGTIFEVGWARRHELPVVGLITDIDNDGTKMLVGSGVELHQDLSSALYRAAWAAQGAALSPGRVRVQSQ